MMEWNAGPDGGSVSGDRRVNEATEAVEHVVVERAWRRGVEIVSRVNYSQWARVRSRLALMPDDMIGRSGWSGPRSVILVTRRLIPEVGPSFFRTSPQSIRMVDGSSLEQPIAS